MARRAYDSKRKDIQVAVDFGWRFCGFAGSGHLQFRHPRVTVRLIMPATPSDPRGMHNSIAWIRRHTPRED